jgi:glycosyltransferase involved in cell wall biosynthesis
MSKRFERDQIALGRVLIVGSGGLEHGGGIGRQMGYFLQAQKAAQGRVRYQVVDTRGPWYLADSPLYLGCAITYFAGAMLALICARLRSMPCLAHINIAGRGSTIRKVIMGTIAGTLGLPYVLHLHDYDYGDYYKGRGTFLKKLIAVVFRRAAIVVVLGRRDHAVISQLFQLPKDRIIILHNAVPDPLPSPHIATPFPEAPCHLLFLGRLSARKGVPELLQALASPSVKFRHWRATLAGDGPIDEFRKIADDLGILDRLCFPGWLDEAGVRTLCRGADVLVLPSHGEGLAMAVLEGLSHGLTVITTPVGAHAEVIEPEVSGLFVPPGDVASLANVLVRVIEDDSLRSRLAKGARDRFLAEFDVRRYASRLAEVHASLLVPYGRQSEKGKYREA